MSAATAYPLQMLIGVCKLREDAASSKVRAAEYAVSQEEENGRRLEKELREYIVWRLAEEDRRYDELIGTESSGVDMEKFRSELGLLKVREVEYEREIIESGRRVVELRKKVEEARVVYMAAVQETMKIDAHRANWLEEWNTEQARLEDVEMEEFNKPVRSGDDEDESPEEDEDDE